MPELMRDAVGLPWTGRWRGGDRSVALKHKLMLGMISAMLGALLQGCTAGKHPSQEETSLANAAKDVTIPLEAGKMRNPLPGTDEGVSEGQEVLHIESVRGRDSTVPIARILDGASLVAEVRVDQPISLGVALPPLKVIQQCPGMVGADSGSIGDSAS